MTESRDIDLVIDRLDEALHAARLAGLEPPADVDAIDEVAGAVAPYSLPAELRRYWERVDPESIEWFPFPRLTGPAETLAQLKLVRDADVTIPIVPPPLLLPLDYASHCYGVVELASQWGEGGAILEWGFDEAQLVSHTVADRLDLLAELVSEGCLERVGDYVSLDHEAEAERRTARLTATGPHRLYAERFELPTALESWPVHWLAASGVDLRSREPLGATHTIQELIAAAEGGRAIGRIHGKVTNLAGSAAGSLIVIDDGTTSLEVWCPAGASLWGPVHRARQEVEVTIEGPVGPPADLAAPHAEVTRQALAGNLEAVQDAALALFDVLNAHRAAAVATDIRPFD